MDSTALSTKRCPSGKREAVARMGQREEEGHALRRTFRSVSGIDFVVKHCNKKKKEEEGLGIQRN